MKTRTPACRIGAGLSTSQSAWNAAAEAARKARDGMTGGAEVDLAFVFLSPEHLDEAESAVEAVRDELMPRNLLGCVADGVIAGARELESGAAAAVLAVALPGAEIECFHAEAVPAGGRIAVVGLPRLDDPTLVVLVADPFTFPVVPFLARLNTVYDRTPLVGGLAAGGSQAGAQVLIVDEAVHAEGAAGAIVSGAPVLTAVSPGCRPIGREAVVTRCEGNVVFELAGQPALERLRRQVAALPAGELMLAARGLLAGLVIDENRPEYDTGDYVMRDLLDADEESGAITLGDAVRVGQTLRFFVHDSGSADADLRRALAGALPGAHPAGALLFAGHGRGTNMFAQPDHDARLVAETLGTHALAGFFSRGEIGPIAGKAFLHGYTATLAVFLER